MSTHTPIGRIDEAGYLKGFSRRGYTKAKCLLELTANCLDSFDLRPQIDSAQRKEICYSVDQHATRIFDNAAGMTAPGLDSMFAMHSENHVSESSRGVSGAGGKVAQSILGNKKLVKVLTRQRGEAFLCAVAPWDVMHREGRYTGMIQQREMTEEEKQTFIQERLSRAMLMDDEEAVGTTIEFKSNAELSDLIVENFIEIKESTLTKPLDRIQIVFGHEQVDFTHIHFESDEVQTLHLYNYFSADQNEYYCSKTKTVIEQWEHTADGTTETLFIAKYGDEDMMVSRYGRGYSKESTVRHMNLSGYRMVGTFEHVAGLRIDSGRIFDLQNPRLLTAETILPIYDEPFLGRSNEEYLNQNKLVRNNQVIGTFLDPETKTGNARGGGFANLEIRLLQCELRFNPKSRQDNPQDIAVGIQENKNQFSGKDMPVNLTRLVRWLNKQKADEIWDMMERKSHDPRVIEEPSDDESEVSEEAESEEENSLWK